MSQSVRREEENNLIKRDTIRRRSKSEMIGQQLKMDVGTQEPKGVSQDSVTTCVTVSQMGGHKMGDTRANAHQVSQFHKMGDTRTNDQQGSPITQCHNKCEEALL